VDTSVVTVVLYHCVLHDASLYAQNSIGSICTTKPQQIQPVEFEQYILLKQAYVKRSCLSSAERFTALIYWLPWATPNAPNYFYFHCTGSNVQIQYALKPQQVLALIGWQTTHHRRGQSHVTIFKFKGP